MQTFYKIFIVVFLLFIGFNLYSIQWELGFLHPENSMLVLSLAAAVLGLILVYVLHTWSKLRLKP